MGDAWYGTPHGQKDMFGHQQTPVRTVNVDTIESYVKSRLETVFKGAVLEPFRTHTKKGGATCVAILRGLESEPKGCTGRDGHCPPHSPAARAAIEAQMTTQGRLLLKSSAATERPRCGYSGGAATIRGRLANR